MTLRLAILASGRGSNLRAIHKAIMDGRCDAHIAVLISDNADSGALEYARENNIPSHTILLSDFDDRLKHDEAIISAIEQYSVDLVVLAGYMRVLRSSKWFEMFGHRIINIHPSLLPKYSGLDAQKQAFDAGEKVSGCTIHLVDESLDGGRILMQKEVDISECKSADEVSEKILVYEHELYALVIDKIAKKQLRLDG